MKYACKSPADELATEAIGYSDEVGDVVKVTLKRIDNLPRKPKGRHKNSFSKFRTSIGANTVTFPQWEVQLKHIFRNADGHVPDTPANRQLILDVSNNINNYLGKDARGNDWYAFISEDGTQTWVRVRNGIIDNAGVNTVPRIWDSETGLYNNINNWVGECDEYTRGIFSNV